VRPIVDAQCSLETTDSEDTVMFCV